MASAILTPTSSFCFSSLSSSSSSIRIQSFWTLSNSVVSVSQHSNFKFYTPLPQLGLCEFPPWNGLKHLGISISQQPIKLERKGKYKGKGVYASLFGVGAPEALVIGVVALLVFGPKGLAEVARNLGKTLRAFQPTIRELQDVSREFKSTLEREIGLDEIQTSSQKTFSSNPTKASSGPSLDAGSEASRTEIDPNGSPSPSKAFSSEEFLKISEEQLRAAAAKQQEQNISPGESPSEIQSSVAAQQMDTGSSGESQSEIQTQPQVVSDSPQEAASAMPSTGKPCLLLESLKGMHETKELHFCWLD